MDYLRECMNDVGNPPIDVMSKSFCIMCANRGCERAGMNQSAFDNRVKNWKETLFTNVPRAAPDDPTYDNIRSKDFSPIGPPAAPKVTVFAPSTPSIVVPARMASPAAFVQATQEPPLTPSPDSPSAPEPPASPSHGNTAFEQGIVLGGGPPPPQAPARPAQAQSSGAQGKTFILEDDD